MISFERIQVTVVVSSFFAVGIFTDFFPTWAVWMWSGIFIALWLLWIATIASFLQNRKEPQGASSGAPVGTTSHAGIDTGTSSPVPSLPQTRRGRS